MCVCVVSLTLFLSIFIFCFYERPCICYTFSLTPFLSIFIFYLFMNALVFVILFWGLLKRVDLDFSNYVICVYVRVCDIGVVWYLHFIFG